MSQPKEWKRAKYTGKGAKHQHLGIEHWIIERPEFKALKGGPLRVLIHLGKQYNGYNNGNFYVKPLREHINRDTLQDAIASLLSDGWLTKTRFGGLGIGPSLYAITWWAIDDCKGKHDYPAETVASHTWMKNRLVRKPDKLGQESRPGEVPFEVDFNAVGQESRPKNPDSRAA